MKRKIKKGMIFNRWEIIEEKTTKGSARMFLCRCACGEERIISLCSITSGKSKSCGCYNKMVATKHGLSRTKIYNSYRGMLQRCYDKKNKRYEKYGGKGITICDEWLGENGIVNFYNWSITNGWETELSIDRIDNDGGYFPDNCRWTTNNIQMANRGLLKSNKSGYNGVFWDKDRKRWISCITVCNKRKKIGRYIIIKDAIEARNKYILENNLPHKIQEYKE